MNKECSNCRTWNNFVIKVAECDGNNRFIDFTTLYILCDFFIDKINHINVWLDIFILLNITISDPQTRNSLFFEMAEDKIVKGIGSLKRGY